MTLDLDNGIVAFPDTFGGGIGEVYELASGFKGCCAAADAGAASGLGQQRHRRKAQAVRGRDLRGPARRVEARLERARRPGLQPHLRSARQAGSNPWPTRSGTRPPSRCASQLTLHRVLEAQAQSSSTRIAGLAEGVVLRGDWRQSARRARTTAEASAREGLLTELSRFGVDAAPPLAREAIPFSNSPASEDARGRYESDNKKLEAEIEQAQQGAGAAAARRRSGDQAPSQSAQGNGSAGVSLRRRSHQGQDRPVGPDGGALALAGGRQSRSGSCNCSSSRAAALSARGRSSCSKARRRPPVA